MVTNCDFVKVFVTFSFFDKEKEKILPFRLKLDFGIVSVKSLGKFLKKMPSSKLATLPDLEDFGPFTVSNIIETVPWDISNDLPLEPEYSIPF